VAEGASTSQEAPPPPAGPPDGPPPGDTPPPPGAPAPPGATPPGGYAGSAFPLRHGLVRPRQGRYLAGVCAAIGRATNTDPVLWRVLLAVLGFFGGIGILIYLAVWLITPAEGDSASPIEGLLGRGRSSTSPVLVIVLGMLVALVFGIIVTDGFRAVLLGAVVLIGGALLLNRNSGVGARPATPAGPYPDPSAGPYPDPYSGLSAGPYPGPPGTPVAVATPPGTYPPPAAGQLAYPATPDYPAGAAGHAGPSGPPAGYPPPPVSGGADIGYGQHAGQSGTTAPLTLPTPPAAPPGGYRPAFAPRGPYRGGGQPPYPPPPVAPPPVPPAPKPPKERSRLGAATISMVFVALGVVAALDLSNTLHIGPSAYFFGALVTVALGLLVGAWLGRARWLIVLGIALSIALGVATAGESWDQVGNVGSDVVWRASNPDEVANRYENNFGDALLDLSAVDFAGQDRRITVEVNFGAVEVILPPEVDVTARVEVGAGEASVFDNTWSGLNQPGAAVTDLGPDGTGGGRLDLRVVVNAGDAEVHR
jgi:phage shock protein PspC (stress-responsive transcriptional regulator)